ncbi:hypothetical protein [Parachitinimonas caeni]|uniref:Uncharacterized protein n=1 Tax=Parachitinimonas caeni TaxID=3031301 RepID=A0ABT7E368_9NEIS|nr:hypothetical protein [Parachitinimonas caeni]MDK2126489.1 hypothetical protein [Parachitinimonas caeni]
MPATKSVMPEAQKSLIHWMDCQAQGKLFGPATAVSLLRAKLPTNAVSDATLKRVYTGKAPVDLSLLELIAQTWDVSTSNLLQPKLAGCERRNGTMMQYGRAYPCVAWLTKEVPIAPDELVAFDLGIEGLVIAPLRVALPGAVRRLAHAELIGHLPLSMAGTVYAVDCGRWMDQIESMPMEIFDTTGELLDAINVETVIAIILPGSPFEDSDLPASRCRVKVGSDVPIIFVDSYHANLPRDMQYVAMTNFWLLPPSADKISTVLHAMLHYQTDRTRTMYHEKSQEPRTLTDQELESVSAGISDTGTPPVMPCGPNPTVPPVINLPT